MTHRSYPTTKVAVPSQRSFNKQCYKFLLDRSIVEDFYNILQGNGRWYTAEDHRNKVVVLLEASVSSSYQHYPEETLNKQIKYDDAARAFVSTCIKQGWVSTGSIESDLLKINESMQAGFKDYRSDDNIPTTSDLDGVSIPDFTGGLPSDHQGHADAVDYLRSVCDDDYIDDIRLYSPTIQKNLEAIRQISQVVKASLAYNKGTAKRDSNEKTDFATQRPSKSLQEARFMARSEYAYDCNTRLMRLATNQAQVLVPQKKTRKKFARFLLLDCSGSMQSYNRVHKAAAVLLDSIESVVKHGDVLHLAFFGDDFIYKGAVTHENAHDVLLSVCNEYNYYSDNDCYNPLQQAWDILQADESLQKLEIILLTDGLIRNFKQLDTNCNVVVHSIDLSGDSDTQYPIKRTVQDHGGTITRL